MCVLLIVYGIMLIVKHNNYPALIAFGAIYITLALAAGLFVWMLLGFHTYLSATNTTTNEMCKKSWQGIAGNPFSKTQCWKNVLKIFFGQNGKNTVDPEKILEKRKSLARKDSTKKSAESVNNDSVSSNSKEEITVNQITLEMQPEPNGV